MNVHEGIPDSPIDEVSLAIGSFDGVHLGHQDVIRRLRAGPGAAVVVTFEPHPRCVLDPANCPKSLTVQPEKLALLSRHGVDHALTLNFTPEIARLAPEEFLGRLARGMSIRRLVCGADFAFGRGRSGTVAWLREQAPRLGFDVEVAEPVRVDDQELHSSDIRRLLADEGDIPAANRRLGSEFSLWGTVEHGAQVGRAIGFPTANLALPLNKLVPKPGIYAARFQAGERSFAAALSIGYRPTFGGDRLGVEVFVIDFSGDLYGQHVGVAPVLRLRDEVRYESAAELAAQIARDVEETRRVLEAGKS